MKHVLGLAAVLLALWLGLSGHFDPLLVSLGIASVGLSVFLALRMELTDREVHLLHLTFPLAKFWSFLVKEIVLANLDVVKRILRPGPSISPQLVELPLGQRSALSKVIYANAITLTPGTVSVRLDERLLVHALSREGAEDLASGRMGDAVPDDLEHDES